MVKKACIGLFFIFLMTPIVTLAQEQMAVTADGDSVLLYTNGSWKYLTDSSSMIAGAEVKIVKDEKDPFAGTRKVITETWMNFGKSNQGLLFGCAIMTNDYLGFNIGTNATIGCLKQTSSTLKVQLENEEIIEFIQLSEDNCAAVPTAIFVLTDTQNTPETYAKIKNQKWVSLRLEGANQSLIYTPKASKRFDSSTFFSSHLMALEDNQ